MGLVSTSVAVRLLPESSSSSCVRCAFSEHFPGAVEKRTPVVINPQRRLIHRVYPRGSTSCAVNIRDVAIQPFFRSLTLDQSEQV